MTRKWLLRWGSGMAVALAISCVTVNIYFPAAEVQKAADQIVDEVRPETVPPADESSKPKKESLDRRLLQWISGLCVATAEAQVDINVSSPAIRSLKSSLKARFKTLKPYYKKGAIGENNQGYLELRDLDGLNLKQKAEIRRLVKAEKKDRRDLYEEILRANNLKKRFLPEVEKLFANSWREKAARKGWWYQKDDGSWVR